MGRPGPARLPRRSRAERPRHTTAFGIAYVAEGATLGGQVLYKRLKALLEPLPLRWLQG